MGIAKKIKDKKNYTVAGKPMSKKEFVQFVKESEESGDADFDKGIEIIEERLEEYRKIKK
jgi:hypothetical protein